jgi:hypothetical protein
MQPLVIRQGDYLAKLADQLGFDADAVWGDDSNAQLRLLRPNPNILFAGDVLYVPDPAKAPPAQSLTPGSTNSFVTNAPAMVSVSITFTDPGLASQAYTVPELPQLTGLTAWPRSRCPCHRTPSRLPSRPPECPSSTRWVTSTQSIRSPASFNDFNTWVFFPPISTRSLSTRT